MQNLSIILSTIYNNAYINFRLHRSIQLINAIH